MVTKKNNLPLKLDENSQESGSISYANEVIAVIAGVATNEVEGVAGMYGTTIFSRNKQVTKGVKVELGTEEASVDLYIIVEYGTPIQTAATNVQENVRKAIETMTGLHVVRVDVHVQGVSFDKENKQSLAGLETLQETLDVSTAPATETPVEKDVVAQEVETETVLETPEAVETEEEKNKSTESIEDKP